MFYQQGEGREARFDRKDGDGGCGEAVGGPSLNPSPEGVESILHFHEGGE